MISEDSSITWGGWGAKSSAALRYIKSWRRLLGLGWKPIDRHQTFNSNESPYLPWLVEDRSNTVDEDKGGGRQIIAIIEIRFNEVVISLRLPVFYWDDGDFMWYIPFLATRF